MKTRSKKQELEVAKAQVRDDHPASRRVMVWAVDFCHGPLIGEGSSTRKSMHVGILDAITQEMLHAEALLRRSPWNFAEVYEVLSQRHGRPVTVLIDYSLWLLRQLEKVCASKGTRIEYRHRGRIEVPHAMEGWFHFAHESMSPQSSASLGELNRHLELQRQQWNADCRRCGQSRRSDEKRPSRRLS
jgi:hypothetical protein